MPTDDSTRRRTDIPRLLEELAAEYPTFEFWTDPLPDGRVWYARSRSGDQLIMSDDLDRLKGWLP